MSHHSVEDRLLQATWVTGTPGCGFNTVAGKHLQGFMMDWIGYRTTHLRHREWFISLEVLKYKITDPEMTNPWFYGFGQNWEDIVLLPWHRVVMLTVDYRSLYERVTAYRRDNKIVDGSTIEEVVDGLYDNQEKMRLKLAPFRKVHFLDASRSPEELAMVLNLQFKHFRFTNIMES